RRPGGPVEETVVERYVRLDPVVDDLRAVRAALLPGLERVGEIHAGNLLVVADRGLRLALRAADDALVLDLDRDEVVGVHVVVLDVAAGERHLELPRV